MRFVVITGLSGAGKSTAVKAFEDMGYFCIDNMPTALISKFAEICATSNGRKEKFAFVIDARGGSGVEEFLPELRKLEEWGNSCEILFLEANDTAITARYKETRRQHPSSPTGRITDGISYEREILKNVRKNATYIVDTSDKNQGQTREEIINLFADSNTENSLYITILSFGFKHGIPIDSDLVFDVRFLPNPFYVKELKGKTGLYSEVSEFVFKYEQTQEFVIKLEDMLEYTIPYYIEEGKTQLVVSVGCTGGHHRSVAISERLNEFLVSKGYKTKVVHRDIEK